MAESTTINREDLVSKLLQLGGLLRTPQIDGAGPLIHLNLTLAQLRIVLLLNEMGVTSMSPLASKLGITPSACTALVDKLVRSGLVARSAYPSDRRVVRCSLTEKGQALAERLQRRSPFERQEFLDGLTDDELMVVVQAVTIAQRGMVDSRTDHNGHANT
ncbi:MAG: MarR family transcriptional regulator [Chloroflexi bacterium]|nr:MarR family transcriptional regulator [Chloroflexota bacterium]